MVYPYLFSVKMTIVKFLLTNSTTHTQYFFRHKKNLYSAMFIILKTLLARY
jgi:hypothetical protein